MNVSKVLSMFDEVAMMSDLKTETVGLIHATTAVKPIKKLITIHDMIDLNLEIEKNFTELDGPVWDFAALQEISNLRRELVVCHRIDFRPIKQFDSYNANLLQLFNILALRYNRSLI